MIIFCILHNYSVDFHGIMTGAGHCTLDTGRWTLDAGHWTLDAGHWTLEAAVRFFPAAPSPPPFSYLTCIVIFANNKRPEPWNRHQVNSYK